MGKIKYKKSTKVFKISGIELCKTSRDYNFKKKELLNLIIKERNFENYIQTDILRFCNNLLYRRIEDRKYITVEIAGIFKSKINKLKEVQKTLIQIVPPEADKIFILNSNLGEAHYFLKYLINNLTEENDNVLIITNKKSHLELIDLFVPHIKSLFVKNYKYDIDEDVFNIGKQKFYVLYNTNFYINAEQNIRTTNKIYPQIMEEVFTENNHNQNFNEIQIGQGAKDFVDEYLLKNDIKDFIFLSDCAKTCEEIPQDFWSKLRKNLPLPVIKNTKELPLAFAYEFAKRSSVIITHRSGLSEILSDIDKPHFVIYSDFKDRYKFQKLTSDRAICGYSLKNYPAVSGKIVELEYNKQNENEIIETIAGKINERDKEYENYCTGRG